MLESLEARRLLTVIVGNAGVTAFIDGRGALHVKGTDEADYINVAEQRGVITELSVGADAGSAAEITSLLGAPVTGIFIDAKGGDDTVNLDTDVVDGVVWGGNGNDTITVNNIGAGTTIADGGNGNDSLTCVAGHNTVLVGGNGDDVLKGADSGNVFMFAGNGDDTMILKGTGSFADGGNGYDTAAVLGTTLGTFRVEVVIPVPI